MHLQYLGHAIANDPIYSNAEAWGPTGGKGGLFKPTLDRPALEETQRLRREMGEKQMEKEKWKVIRSELKATREAAKLQSEVLSEGVAGTEGTEKEFAEKVELPIIPNLTLESLNEEISPDDIDKYSNPTRLHSIINKRGQIKAGFGRADLTSVGDDPERMDHEVPLTEECRVVMAALRIVKDEADGWARWKDQESIDKAKKAEALEAALAERKGEIEGEDSNLEEVEEVDEGDGTFCTNCFVPIVPDPRPDQLFIWLHALRYKTTEWDYQSELPYWSLES